MDNTNLKSYVDRLVQLKTEKKQVSEFIADLKAEAKSNGFDAGAIDKISNRILSKEDAVKRQKECDEITRVYAEAIGQLSLFE